MTLPPIPDEAVTAVLLAAGVPDAEPGEREWARGDLAAAWPFLYATALRHAANKYGVATTLAGGYIDVVVPAATLRWAADEAVEET